MASACADPVRSCSPPLPPVLVLLGLADGLGDVFKLRAASQTAPDEEVHRHRDHYTDDDRDDDQSHGEGEPVLPGHPRLGLSRSRTVTENKSAMRWYLSSEALAKPRSI